jgi:hypothetical protein
VFPTAVLLETLVPLALVSLSTLVSLLATVLALSTAAAETDTETDEPASNVTEVIKPQDFKNE